MLYRNYGDTNKKISVISAGGMRFKTPENSADVKDSAAILLRAYEQGVNYFDTAPLYCGDRSEEIVGAAVREMEPGSYYVSTKSSASDGKQLRADLERSLKRLGLDRIHFFHIWCLLKLEVWEQRKQGGAVEAALRARDEGLVEHVVFSSHLTGRETASVIKEGVLEGVTLGYNALNFPYRQEGLQAAAEAGLGVVAMNPLAGGLIPRNAERFDFIRRENDPDVVTAALRFNISHPAITSALVGFSSREEVDQAVKALDGFVPYEESVVRKLEKRIERQFEGLCTGCGYCLPCPEGLPVTKYMDVYNTFLLGGTQEDIQFRLNLHWDIKAGDAARCTACGQCEQACTQHLPIIERMQEIATWNDS